MSDYRKTVGGYSSIDRPMTAQSIPTHVLWTDHCLLDEPHEAHEWRLSFSAVYDRWCPGAVPLEQTNPETT